MKEAFEKLAAWWKRWQHLRRHPEAAIVVGFDAEVFWCEAPEEPRRQVAWAHLQRVVIHTTDQGPFQPDVFWHLESDTGEHVTFPNGATGSSEALKRLQELPGFDNHAVMAAMFSTENAVFVCWNRDDETAE